MHVSRGDLGGVTDVVVNNEVPLPVTSVGNIRPRSTREFHTIRPEGREDYQLIYVADGCMHFRFAENAPETIVKKGNMVLFWPNQHRHYELPYVAAVVSAEIQGIYGILSIPIRHLSAYDQCNEPAGKHRL